MARSSTSRRQDQQRLLPVLNTVLALTALVAVAALVVDYGFVLSPMQERAVRIIQTSVLVVFILDRVLRLLVAPRRKEYLRENWIEFALMVLVVAGLLIGYQMKGRILSAGTLYVIITQLYILAALALRGVGLNLRFAGSGIHPSWLLVGSFLLLILAGSGLLMLPAAVGEQYYPKWYYDDALFTSTSAVCVTGLVVRDTGTHFTTFGQAVVLGLIQAGGLGIMLFGTLLAMVVGRGLSLRGTTAVQHMLSSEEPGQIGRLVKFVVLTTLAAEAVGAVLLYPMFCRPQGPPDALVTLEPAQAAWHSVFHSVSAFCNAGFALYGNSLMQGTREGWLHPMRDNWQVYGVIAPLIILGGLGFPVLEDCAQYLKQWAVRLSRRKHPRYGHAGLSNPRPRLTLHSKIVVSTTAVLIAGGAALLLLVEPPPGPRGGAVGRHAFVMEDTRQRSDWSEIRGSRRVLHALFTSVTARTAGFNTIDMAELSNAGKLAVCLLMIIGASPASTGGGLKTVTAALLVLTVYSTLLRRNDVELFRRSIATEVLRKAVTVSVLFVAMLITLTFLLSVELRQERNFLDLFFEVTSACCTVGLSTGLTSHLATPWSKIIIVIGMFVGRLGPLTLLAGFASRVRRVDYHYPQETVIIG